ncbi:MAG: cell division protein ZapA [Sphingomonadaceae bacterium]|nr:cell division protein ZapA [Sphingomonadaceae bacterium]
MSEVRLSIGGKAYTIACADGQEDHVSRLGALVDAKLAEFGPNRAPQEAQNMLFAALLIAEDLHQARNGAMAHEETLDNLRLELATAQRERNVAMGQHDQLHNRISSLETELANLQSAAQSAARESDDIKAELARTRSELADAEQVEAELRAGLAGLAEERDALQLELDDARATGGHGPAMAGATSGSVDPGLAPALERFAEMLESCADKLESKLASA